MIAGALGCTLSEVSEHSLIRDRTAVCHHGSSAPAGPHAEMVGWLKLYAHLAECGGRSRERAGGPVDRPLLLGTSPRTACACRSCPAAGCASSRIDVPYRWSATVSAIDPLPSLSTMLKWEGPLSFRGAA